MILSDRDIRRRLEIGDIEIDPLDDPDLQIQPASVDLRLGTEFLTFQSSNIPCIRPNQSDAIDGYVEKTTVPDATGDGQQSLREFEHEVGGELEDVQREFILHPGDFVLGTTKERVGIPPDLLAHVEGRSSLGRLAIVVHASLPYDEEVFIWTPEEGYGFHQIGDLVEEERPAWAVSFDPKTLEISTHRISNYITNPRQRIYRVTLESGRQVHVTADHNLFTLDENGGVSRIPSEEAVGTRVMVPGRLPRSPTEESTLDLATMFSGDDEIIAYASDGFGEVTWKRGMSPSSIRHYESRGAAPFSCLSRMTVPADLEVAVKQSDIRVPRMLTISNEFAWVLGFYIAEGSARRKQLQFANNNTAYLDRVEAWFAQFDIEPYRYERDNGCEVVTICSRLWSKIFRRLAGSGSEKNIPERAFNWPESVLESLLEGVIDGDGCRRDSRDTIYTAREPLANRLLWVATRLGYLASAYSREREVYIEPSDVHHQGTEWSVDISSESHKRGQYVPNPHCLLRQLRTAAGMTMEEAAQAIGNSSKSSISNLENRQYDAVRRETLEKLSDVYGSAGADTTRIDQLLREDVRFERVTDVEATDRNEVTYDLEVQPNGQVIENFLGGRGGIFLSNTAGLCDPGYEGQITLELSNLGTAPVALTPDMRIAQLTFTELTSPAERPYGAERGSKYQGQQGPQASRLERDPEFDHDE